MRAIVRFSINDDYGSGLRNQLCGVLEGSGLELQRGTTTATYEGYLNESALRDTMRRFWNTAHNYAGRAHLDHFWMYADKKADPDNDENNDDDD